MQVPRSLDGPAPDTVTVASGGGNPFSCNVCGRSYTRIDHLARHFRSHTREKPFTCEVCNKDFARADLLKRHAANHNNENSQNNKRQKVSQPTRPRISQACVSCAEAKLRCEGPAPCKRCQQRGTVCRYPESRQKKSVSQSNPEDPAGDSSGVDEFDATKAFSVNEASVTQLPFSNSNTSAVPTNPQSRENIAMDQIAQLPTPLTFDPSLSFAPNENPMDSLDGTTNYDDLTFADFLKDIMIPTTPGGAGRQHRIDNMFAFSPKDVLDFNADMAFDMPDMFDPSQLAVGDFTFQPGKYDEQVGLPSKSGYTTPAGRGGISLGAQAFRESLWLWTPAKGDHTGAEQLNLSVPSQDMLPETQHTPMELRIGVIDRVARDRILATILDTCDTAVIPRVVQSFPSADLLTTLMHIFLSHHSALTDNWIHVASFDPNSENPEFLIAIIAAGAGLSPLPDVRKLGFAISEASRHANGKMFERDNRCTRNLRPLQALAIQLDAGLWSGDRRKMEIAESFAQPLITMMRRGGRFRQPRNPITAPEPEDDERTTETKWYQWVEAESYRRLAFHLIIRDCHTSVSLLVPPLVSYAEVSLDMPTSKDLWLARNAGEWKELYLNQFNGISSRQPSLRACIDDMSPITAHQATLDIKMTVMIILSGLWALTWQYREMTTAVKLHSTGGLRNSALITNSLYQEISQLLIHFKMVATEWTGGMEPLARVLYERQLMHLHVSLEDVQLLAGKEGEEEARRVFPLLGAWAENKESRLALWHAGQVIRAATDYRKFGLRFSSAIALYHASLVLWAYSVVSKSVGISKSNSKSLNMTGGAESQPQAVRLDGEDNSQVQKFIILGVGTPVISQGEDVTENTKLIPISDAKRVMLAITALLRQKNEFEDKGCPPLVENLSKLMRSLGNAAQGMRRH